uniref:Uncharacterized protein n=1 Tax=Aegilops tauschii subsp. strangulata TaxID=200361 RepID=A0A453I8K5_AEGTS|nr:uncharacterized protein LOC120961799 [Aegilops tauschii subsp. strangulata]
MITELSIAISFQHRDRQEDTSYQHKQTEAPSIISEIYRNLLSDVQASGGREVVGDSFSGNVVSASHTARSSRDCTNPSPAVLLVVAVWLWLLLSASGALADGGNGTVCMCMGPQCVPPCPVPGTPTPTTSPTQFPFCPQRPPEVGPFPSAASRRSPPT